ncbi:DUF427 domain-containing protein [Allosphingosinicella deserti]|uniref:DUF427 domain-containing protein n=1 Tax=Allosphingosinicella deserti TaxID=2116704 RepID=A0A2P7QIY3_9SPHN|nr:DUF427 domain-containing protein [Sphingomonas deserti]PSJ37937.1 hypothetical protein C7I55_19705 [Sphingomonas deserti]
MSQRPQLVPHAGHPIIVEPNPRRIIVRAGETVIGDTGNALSLREASYPAVHYIPREDVDMGALKRSAHSSYCPYKGEAAYFDIVSLGEPGRNAVWTYEQPFDAVADIAGHLAFYPERVSIAEKES